MLMTKLLFEFFFFSLQPLDSVNGNKIQKNDGKEQVVLKVLKVICNSPCLLFTVDMLCTVVV